MPPVQRMSSAPCSCASSIASTISSTSSPGRDVNVVVTPKAASFSSMTGVKRSWMRPFFTSDPVAMIAAVKIEYGFTLMSGRPPAARSAFSTVLSSTTSGITRVPASASPVFTPKPPLRVATMTSSTEFTAKSRSVSTRKTPSVAALMPILPSEGSPEATVPSPRQSAASRFAASFSWSMPGSISQT